MTTSSATATLPDDLDFALAPSHGPEPVRPAQPEEPGEEGRSRLTEFLGRLRSGLVPRRLQTLAGASLYQTLSENEPEPAGEESRDLVADQESAVKAEDLLLAREGLQPTHTLLDFGTRSGRLGVRIIPGFQGGHYVGVDISAGMLQRARSHVSWSLGKPPCRVTWIHQTSTVYPVANASVDMMCSFAALTHFEPEDVFRYLRNARRVVKPGGKLLFTFLPFSHPAAQQVFLETARHELAERWMRQRTFTSSQELMTGIARTAGWEPLHAYKGQERLPAVLNDETASLVGTTMVLRRGER